LKNQDKIVFINQNAGYLMIDIINAHASDWQKMALLTGKLVQRDVPLNPGVKVDRIVTYRRNTTLARLFTWTWGFVQIFWLIKLKYRNAHLYIVTNPSFATLLPLVCKNSYTLLIFDIYPDALVEYKVLSANSFIIRLWRKANKLIFPKADNIFVLSNGMKKLVSQYVDAHKIYVVPLWTHNEFFKTVSKEENPFIAQHNLQDKFIVMYSGNLGFTHNLEVLLDVAAAIKNPEVFFLIIGDGDKKKSLEEKAKRLALENCKFLPLQDVSMLPYSMAASDVGVVSLGSEASLLSVPSKTFNLLSVGVPLLCIADERSELSELVKQYGCGRCFDGKSIESIKAYIEFLVKDVDYRNTIKEKSLAASLNFGLKNAKQLIAFKE
jgi:glycosyltransferase involved in cell wall biosynthesis